MNNLVVNEIRFRNKAQSSLIKKLDENKDVRIIIYHDQPFNYSKLVNLGVENAKGDILCLLNDDIEVISNDWLEELVSALFSPNKLEPWEVVYYSQTETFNMQV